MDFLFESLSLNIIFSFFLFVITWLCYISVNTHNHWKNLNVKYVKPVPLFGNSFHTIFRKKTLVSNQQEIYNSYPDEKYIGMFLFRSPILMIRDPQLIHRILTKDFSHFYDRGISTDKKLDLLSLHLVNLKGLEWKKLRNKLTPAFSSGKLRTMCPNVEECADALQDHIDILTYSNCAQDIYSVIVKYATNVIGSCAFGLDMIYLKDPDSPFYKMALDIFKPSIRVIMKFITRAIHPKIPYYLKLKIIHPDVEEFFLNFVKNTLRQREQSSEGKRDFIQILLELNNDDANDSSLDKDFKGEKFVLNDNELASNVFAFFLGGFETISSTMSFLLLELASNPHVQESLRNEIINIIEKYNGEINYDIIKELKYTEMVICETLRKYPIGTVLLRECTKSYEVPDSSFVIEKGTRIFIPVYALHHDPEYFPKPDQFIPERFSPENKDKIMPGTYLPFGEGPRICIGVRFALMEIKYALYKVLPKYEFALSEKTVYPVLFKKGVPLLNSENGFWLQIKKIK